MGYMKAMGPCIRCGQVFSFNPLKVPSSSAVTGKREPICLPCVRHLNQLRVKNGLAPVQVLDGAYEPQDEDEI